MSDRLLDELLQAYVRKGWKIRTAESCTAGGIAACIGSVAGASNVLDRGWVTYSNEAKIEELHVDAQLIERFGAVSEEVVRAMAEAGASEDAVCIAVSGIAGPAGGSDDKPVGTVWMAIARPGSETRAGRYLFDGSRNEIQQATIEMALHWLCDYARDD